MERYKIVEWEVVNWRDTKLLSGRSQVLVPSTPKIKIKIFLHLFLLIQYKKSPKIKMNNKLPYLSKTTYSLYYINHELNEKNHLKPAAQ